MVFILVLIFVVICLYFKYSYSKEYSNLTNIASSNYILIFAKSLNNEVEIETKIDLENKNYLVKVNLSTLKNEFDYKVCGSKLFILKNYYSQGILQIYKFRS